MDSSWKAQEKGGESHSSKIIKERFLYIHDDLNEEREYSSHCQACLRRRLIEKTSNATVGQPHFGFKTPAYSSQYSSIIADELDYVTKAAEKLSKEYEHKTISH